jgi:Flp pilus assembly protein TadD
MTTLPSNDDKIREIARAADGARAAGRRDEASRLLAQAQAIAPDHPMTHNLLGLHAVRGGDADSARRHFELQPKRTTVTRRTGSIWPLRPPPQSPG